MTPCLARCPSPCTGAGLALTACHLSAVPLPPACRALAAPRTPATCARTGCPPATLPRDEALPCRCPSPCTGQGLPRTACNPATCQPCPCLPPARTLHGLPPATPPRDNGLPCPHALALHGGGLAPSPPATCQPCPCTGCHPAPLPRDDALPCPPLSPLHEGRACPHRLPPASRALAARLPCPCRYPAALTPAPLPAARPARAATLTPRHGITPCLARRSRHCMRAGLALTACHLPAAPAPPACRYLAALMPAAPCYALHEG